MKEATKFDDAMLEAVKEATVVNQAVSAGRIAELVPGAEEANCVIAFDEEAGKFVLEQKEATRVPLTLRNSATGQAATRQIVLDKTVAELLVFDSLNLFPEVPSSRYRIRDFVVRLLRTNQSLQHSNTLRGAGVAANDTLVIFGPRDQ